MSSRTRTRVLGDISCDSDGKVDQFIDRRDVKKTLPLHPFNGEPYYPRRVPGGRVPGDPGRPAQPVRRHQRGARRAGRKRRVVLDAVIQGDTVREVLDYVQFKSQDAGRAVPAGCGSGRSRRRIGYEESGALLRFYEDGLERLHLPGALSLGPERERQFEPHLQTLTDPISVRTSSRLNPNPVVPFNPIVDAGADIDPFVPPPL